MTRRFAIVSVLAAVAAQAAGCAEEPPPELLRPVLSVEVGGADALAGRWWPGRAKATLEVDLGFEVTGQLMERAVNVGDEVPAGTVMARLDPRDFENLLARAQAEAERARAFYERVEIAARTGAVAKQDLDDARARLNQAEAQVRIRQKAVDDARIVAPFDGVVSRTFVDNFQNVQAKQPVIRFLDVGQTEMIINIPENLVGYSRYVQNIRIRCDAFPGVEIPARIKEIGNEASEATRTYPITLIFDPLEHGVNVKPGMACESTADVPQEVRPGGVEVPQSALFTPEGEESQQTFVWILDPESSTVQKREVELGEFTPRGGSIVTGVQPGERVVTAGVNRLREGQPVLVE